MLHEICYVREHGAIHTSENEKLMLQVCSTLLDILKHQTDEIIFNSYISQVHF